MLDALSSLLGLAVFAWGLAAFLTRARPAASVPAWLRPRHHAWRSGNDRARLSVGVLLCGVLLMAASPVLLQLAAVAGVIVLLFSAGPPGRGDA